MKKVGACEAALHGYMRSAHADLMKNINETGDFNDAIEAELNAAIAKFKQTQTW